MRRAIPSQSCQPDGSCGDMILRPLCACRTKQYRCTTIVHHMIKNVPMALLTDESIIAIQYKSS